MSWELRKLPAAEICPELIYEISLKHKLVPSSPEAAVRSFHSLASGGFAATVQDGDEVIATVIVSNVVRGESVDMDFIPVSKHFRSGFQRRLSAAMLPIWPVIFMDMGARRINAFIPESRVRTQKALAGLGFALEGTMRGAACLVGRDPEDLYVMGLLPEDITTEE